MRLALLLPRRRRDYLHEAVVEGLQELDVALVASDPESHDEEAADDDAFLDLAQGCDGLVVLSGKVRTEGGETRGHVRRRLIPRILATRSMPVAYVDASEWTCTGWETLGQVEASRLDPRARRGEPWIDEEMLALVGPQRYLKRETCPEDLARGVVPLPYGLVRRHDRSSRLVPYALRDVDVFCSFGQLATGLRLETDLLCRDLARERPDLKVIVDGSLSPERYAELLGRSRIAIDAWGGGDHCVRFWETVGTGVCCLQQRHRVLTPDDFEDGRDVVRWDTVEELRARLLELVEPGVGRQRAARVGAAGLAHALAYHTARRRAERLLQALGL